MLAPVTASDRTLWIACIGALALCFYLSIGPYLLLHNDLGWHLATGDLIRQTGAIPATDPWAFTSEGAHWYLLSWLWDAAASFLLQTGGFTALMLWVVMTGGVVALLQAHLCARQEASPWVALVTILLACIAVAFYGPPDVFFAVAPQLVTLLLAIVFYALCAEGRFLWLLPPLMLLWVNLHGGFVAGFVIIGAFGLQHVLMRDRRAVQRLAVIGGLCLLMTLINPLGAGIYPGIAQTLGHDIRKHVSEWMPFFAMATWPGSSYAILFIALFVCSELLTLRRMGKSELAARLLAWFWLGMGLKEMRYLSLFLLLAVPTLALNLTRLTPSLPTSWPRRKTAGAVLALLLLAMPFLYYSRIAPYAAGLPAMRDPKEEIAYLTAHFPHRRLLNHWNYGSALIYHGRGTPRVFIDGRAATAYPDRVLTDYNRLVDQDDGSVLDAHHIDVVLWPKQYVATPTALEHGWSKVFSGPLANVYVRKR